MSRIGKKPIKVPAAVKVELAPGQIKVSSSGQSLTLALRPEVTVNYEQNTGEITVSRNGETRFPRALHGTVRALIANMIQGVTAGFTRDLRIYGTGYGVKQQGDALHVTVGFAKPAVRTIPPGVEVDIKTPNTRGNDTPAEFTVRGADKCAVGQFAAAIRHIRPPEPYLGKGIRYADETIKKKVGKAFGSGA